MKAAFNAVEAQLIPSKGGVFEVRVDDRLIFSKAALDRFPAYQEIPTLIQG